MHTWRKRPSRAAPARAHLGAGAEVGDQVRWVKANHLGREGWAVVGVLRENNCNNHYHIGSSSQCSTPPSHTPTYPQVVMLARVAHHSQKKKRKIYIYISPLSLRTSYAQYCFF